MFRLQKKKWLTMSYKINIVIEEDNDGFYAYCPQLEGCQSQGDSLEEVKQNIHEAVQLYIETLSDDEKQSLVQKKVTSLMLEVQVA